MFHKNKESKDGRVNTCKDCVQQYYLENRDKLKYQANEYRKEHRDKYLEYNKSYYKINKKKMLKRSSKYIKKRKTWFRKIHKQWCQNNKDKIKEYQNTRISRENSVLNTLTNQDWDEIKLYFDNKCCYCGRELPLEKDHFIPVIDEGESTINNIVPACRSCNSSKRTKNFFDWYPEYEYYNEERKGKILKFLNYSD